MKLIVTKFGGTSVGTIDRIKSVAKRIKNEVNNGYNVIVVVSAMAGETNRLIKLVESLTNDYMSDYGYKTTKTGVSFGTRFEYYENLFLSPSMSSFGSLYPQCGSSRHDPLSK